MRQFLRSFGEVFKHMRRGPPTQPVIKVCPICLRKTLKIQTNVFLSLIIPSTYRCSHCNYTGPIYAEIEQKEYEKLDFENFEKTLEVDYLTRKTKKNV